MEFSKAVRKDILAVIVLMLAMAAIPFAIGFERYYLLILSTATVFAIYVVAWNIIGGYAGQLDLAAFVYSSLGGIVAARLMVYYGITPWIGMFAGAGVAAALAAIIGYPTFRFGIKEVWYALLTASLVVIVREIMHMPELLGSLDYRLPWKYMGWYWLRFPTYEQLYWVLVAVLGATMLINVWISNSKIGYYLKAIREDELAAEALGVDVRKYKLIALVTYAAILGFAGYLHISLNGVYTYKNFDSAQSIAVAIMGIIGGLGSIAGAFTSAMTLKIVGEYLRSSFGAVIPGLHLLIYGILLIVVGIFKPEGLASVIEWFKKKVGWGGEG